MANDIDKGIEDTIKRGEPGYDLAQDAVTLTSLIDGEDPETDEQAALMVPIRDNIRKALRALLAVNLNSDDARDLVAAALTEEVE